MEFWNENHPFILPSLFTVLNLISGVIAIILAINAYFALSSWMIIIAVLFDGVDGKIARWTGCETEFGVHLDSLADLVSSGMAPMILIYQITFKQLPWIYTCICLIFIFAGTYRLARFNVLQKGDRSHGYIGLPIPVAGMCVATFYLFAETLLMKIDPITATLLLLFLSTLMVSTVPYAWPKLEWHQGRLKIAYSVFIIFCILGMIIYTKVAFFPCLCLYSLVGLGKWIVHTVRKKWTVHII